jgi:hydrogenase nickel incorporation protein HypB
MCSDCGCETALGRAWQGPTRVIELHQAVLARNDAEAEANRDWFARRGVVALNLMSSPGSGKTTLLERTLRERGDTWPALTLVGDQATDHDARRLRAAGGRAVPITTHSACHLDARMVRRALGDDLPDGARLVFIENVGNLVCPAAFDLGEARRVALLSPPEGEDKPVKYPVLFDRADLVILSKLDLEGPCGWDRAACLGYLRRVNPTVPVIALSARTGEGMAAWYSWLGAQLCA